MKIVCPRCGKQVIALGESSTLSRMLVILFGLAFVLLTNVQAQATLIWFSGIDKGVGPGDARPNADLVKQAFVTEAGPNLVTVQFEDLPIGPFTAHVVGPGITATLVNSDPQIGGIVANGWSGPPQTTGFNTTSGGQKFLAFVPNFQAATSSLTFTFSDPIQAFGAYITALESNVDGVVHVIFNDGVAQDFPLPETDIGGAQFFGFTDAGKLISQLVFQEVQVGAIRDIWGIDDILVAHSVPEPSTCALLAIGGVVLHRVRRRLN